MGIFWREKVPPLVSVLTNSSIQRDDDSRNDVSTTDPPPLSRTSSTSHLPPVACGIMMDTSLQTQPQIENDEPMNEFAAGMTASWMRNALERLDPKVRATYEMCDNE